MPRICCAVVYQRTKEPMKFLWTADLKTHVVHVKDVCNAIIHVRCSNFSTVMATA